ncbi:hypothetical protein SAMN04490243_1001 [Robiginitalea myxolifaciens]|uniref:Bulb-type lectin domain-containing protein n=1 Tax=Robiginitalea myxolifaciens TaxID=400055 RepID=A0A1I6G017_9FLAO|nr:hypothetical protein [Robiginitalea myxolifaciens]SFR35506.1 hypothetical protein SAMN04490243_1001 [Robiginitalea myxolifaciens]
MKIFKKLSRASLIPFVLVLLLVSCSDDQDDLPQNPDPVAASGTIEWTRSFGGSGAESPRSIIATMDGGVAILGFTESTDGDLAGKTTAVNDYWLLKLDAEGQMQWQRTLGGSKDDRGQAVIQTRDGGYAVSGYAMSDDGDGSANNGFHDNWVVRLDGGGNILWERSFGFSGHDHSYDLLQTEDDGFLFAGFMDLSAARVDGFEGLSAKGNASSQHGVGEFWCTKLFADGSLDWQFYFGGSNNDRAHALAPARDGGFVLAGFSESDDFDISAARGSYDFWVIRLAEDGAMVWERSLGGSGIDIASDITPTADGGFLVVGNSFSPDGDRTEALGESDIWLVKLSAQGQLEWERSYGGEVFDTAEGIAPLSDGGYLISGNSRSTTGGFSNSGENDMLFIKIDAQGDVLWERSFGSTGIDQAFDAVEGADGSVYIVGELAAPGTPELPSRGATDLILLKVR